MPNFLVPDGLVKQLPPELLEVLAKQPVNVDRRAGADLVRQYFFPVSHRSLENWPLPTQQVNGKAITSTAALFVVAYAKLKAAPIIVSDRRGRERQVQ